MKIEDFRPIRSQDYAPIKFDWLLTQESDWMIWTNQKITLIIFWLVKNGKDWNPAIPLVKRIFLVPDHIWPKTIKGQPALTHVIRNYVLLLVVPPLCLWWVTHIVTKALMLKILPGQQLPLFPNPPTLLYGHCQNTLGFTYQAETECSKTEAAKMWSHQKSPEVVSAIAWIIMHFNEK